MRDAPNCSSRTFRFGDPESVDAFGEFGLPELDAFRATYGDLGSTRTCLYCEAEVSLWSTTEKQLRYSAHPYDERAFLANDIQVALCAQCGWYRYKIQNWLRDDQYPQIFDVVATLGKTTGDEGLLDEFERFLTARWGERRDLTAAAAERAVAEVFSQELNCRVVYTTNGVYSPDGGIDFVLISADKGVEYAFQVKRRLRNSPERVSEVREFIGAVAGSHYQRGYYVTTARRFTAAARREARDGRANLALRRIDLCLVDGSELLSVLRQRGGVPATRRLMSQWFRRDSIWSTNSFPGSSPELSLHARVPRTTGSVTGVGLTEMLAIALPGRNDL